jgi:hypothetical protein
LGGADGADAGEVHRLGLDRRDELSALLFEVVGFACECLDGLGGAAQRAHGGAVLDVAGGAIT